jgi:hypothetical protein
MCYPLVHWSTLARIQILSKIKYKEVFDFMREEISKIPEINSLGKVNNSLVIFACNLFEIQLAFGKGKKYRIDKKQLVIDVLHSVLNLSDAEKGSLDSTIQYLFDNQLIKRVPSYKWFIRQASNSFFQPQVRRKAYRVTKNLINPSVNATLVSHVLVHLGLGKVLASCIVAFLL